MEMNKFNTANDVLDFAIQNEEKAADFYRGMVDKVKDVRLKKRFLEFAEEEEQHKNRLTGIKESGEFGFSNDKVAQLKLADYLVLEESKDDMTYQQALILAMKREKAAFRLYIRLSEMCTNEMLILIFKALAQEESRHKLSFELEYDEHILKGN